MLTFQTLNNAKQLLNLSKLQEAKGLTEGQAIMETLRVHEPTIHKQIEGTVLDVSKHELNLRLLLKSLPDRCS